MTQGQVQRRLAAILAADIAGYSRLMAADEEATLAALKDCRESVESIVARYAGRIFGTAGDGFVAEFGSAVASVLCAKDIQTLLNSQASQQPEERRIHLRIGINLGDVMVDGNDLMGDGVNIAARLETLAEPGGVYVARSAVEQVAGKIDATFEDLGEHALKNIATPVQVYRLNSSTGAPLQPKPETRARQKPSLAVLPVVNISANPELDSFAAGLSEDLLSVLAEVTELSVQSGAARPMADRSSALQVARSIGVGNILEGKVQGSVNRLRVTLQLVDGTSGKFIWAERFENDAGDLFAVQDEIVRKALIGIRARLIDGGLARIVGSGTTNLAAWLRCSEAFEEWARFSRESNHRARELFLTVRDMDPEWSRPLAGLAATSRESAMRGWGSSRNDDLDEAANFAKQAIELGPDDPTGYAFYGQIQVERGLLEEGIALCEKAVEIAPGDFSSLASLAWSLPRIGELERSLATFARSRSLRPLPSGAVLVNEAFVSHLAGRKERAIDLLHQSRARTDILDVPVRMAALFADSGRMKEAQATIATVLDRQPDATLEEYTGNLPFPDRQTREWYEDLLVAAGFPRSKHAR